jgi:predicted membrane channel-forming protein YqfA (hemolysin III family)
VKLSWNASVKKMLAAVLYVVGAFSVLFVAYQGYEHPGSEVGYMPLYWIGVVLVAVAAILWPKPEGSGEEQGR